MKYENEYNETSNKEEFTKLMSNMYKEIKQSTIERRYYDLKKVLGKQVKHHIHLPEDTTEPPQRKLLELEDMKRYKYKITRQLLLTYNWTPYEINWLEDNDGNSEQL